MKKMTKSPWFIALALIITCMAAACSYYIEVEGENPYLGYPFIGRTTVDLATGQQVWTRNHNAVRVSQSYLPYKERNWDIAVAVPNAAMAGGTVEIGSGTIIDGVLNFSVDDRINSFLSAWSTLKPWFSRYWKNVLPSDNGVKGNVVILYAFPAVPDGTYGMMDRQRIFGTATSITCETILYIYVNKDCVISGEANTNYIDGQYYYRTDGNLMLVLKRGMNMVCRTETYATNFDGYAKIGMKVKNPIENPETLRWVLEQGYRF